jgi:hypothetical protein
VVVTAGNWANKAATDQVLGDGANGERKDQQRQGRA